MQKVKYNHTQCIVTDRTNVLVYQSVKLIANQYNGSIVWADYNTIFVQSITFIQLQGPK